MIQSSIRVGGPRALQLRVSLSVRRMPAYSTLFRGRFLHGLEHALRTEGVTHDLVPSFRDPFVLKETRPPFLRTGASLTVYFTLTKTKLLPVRGLARCDLLRHRIEVQALAHVHRRTIDGGLGQLGDLSKITC